MRIGIVTLFLPHSHEEKVTAHGAEDKGQCVALAAIWTGYVKRESHLKLRLFCGPQKCLILFSLA